MGQPRSSPMSLARAALLTAVWTLLTVTGLATPAAAHPTPTQAPRPGPSTSTTRPAPNPSRPAPAATRPGPSRPAQTARHAHNSVLPGTTAHGVRGHAWHRADVRTGKVRHTPGHQHWESGVPPGPVRGRTGGPSVSVHPRHPLAHAPGLPRTARGRAPPYVSV